MRGDPADGHGRGALAVGRSGIRRLGYGPVRDTLLQARYVSAEGEVVKAGGPTVKNVSGFDLCRLLVGSRGTLGFLGEVILRTRPRARYEQWFSGPVDPEDALGRLHRPTAILWDGATTWVLLEGDERDVEAQVGSLALLPGRGRPAAADRRAMVDPARNVPGPDRGVRRRDRRRGGPPGGAGAAADPSRRIPPSSPCITA